MSGVKGKSGRKKKTLTATQAKQRLQAALPGAIEVIIETVEGTNKDRMRYEAAVELKDSAIGKPRQQTDIDLTARREFTPEEVRLLMRQVYVEEQLEEGNALQRRIEAEGSYQESSTET